MDDSNGAGSLSLRCQRVRQEERPPGIHAPGWNFTAYLTSELVTDLEERGAFAIADLHPDYLTLVDAAKRQMREHFTRRAAEAATSVVEGWKKDGVYPFGGDPKDLIERTERQVFDVVALQLAEALPDFEGTDTKSKKLSMRSLGKLLRKARRKCRRFSARCSGCPRTSRQTLRSS